jgi:tRNA threonylcarbamoyladenosine biosynthesis protein TsaB
MRRIALALDTSTPVLSAAIVAEEGEVYRVLATRSAGPPQVTSTLVPGVFDELLAEATLKQADISVLVTGIGPGLFTGVRVAVATMKAIAFARRLPLIAAGSLEALALGAPRGAPLAGGDSFRFPELKDSGLLCPVLDARKGEIYFGLFRAVNGALEEVGAPEACPPAALVDRLRLFGERVRLFGTGAKIIDSTANDEPRTPGAAEIAVLALSRYAKAEFELSHVLALEPFYLRPPEAEVARRKRLDQREQK